MTQEEAKALIEKYGSVRAAARESGVPRTTLTETAAGTHSRSYAKTHTIPAPLEATRKAGRSLAEFRQSFDKDLIVPEKIRAALAELGSDGWEYEQGFAKLAQLTLNDLGNYRERFIDHVVTIRERRAWAGSKALAAKMRSIL